MLAVLAAQSTRFPTEGIIAEAVAKFFVEVALDGKFSILTKKSSGLV